MKKTKITLIILLGIFAIAGCKKDKASDYKMVSQGPMGDIMVVLESPKKDTVLLANIKEVFDTPYPGIPMLFGESYFKMHTMPTSLFSGYTKRFRSIFEVAIGENAKNVLVQKDEPFAFNQNYMLVQAKSDTAAIRIIKEHQKQILAYYDQGEVNHFTKMCGEQQTVFSAAVSDKLNAWIAAPEYSMKRSEDHFIWASRETKRTSQAIMVYEMPYTDKEQLTKESLIEKKDAMLKKYIEGPDGDGTYMRVENKEAEVAYRVVDMNGYYGVELRGYWTLEGGFMGGPFLMIALVDEPNDRILVLDSYVFAPEAKYSKVRFIREIEGVFRTLRITPKES